MPNRYLMEGGNRMGLIEQFVASRDTLTHRICGSCNESKPLKDFYKDGKDTHGKVRYRRDCKDCYKKTRIVEAKMKGRTKK